MSTSTRPQHLYEFGPYRLDTAEQLLLRYGKRVPLTPKAFETLVALVERNGHLVEKDELMKLVWSDAFVEESNLINNVYALRKMLGQAENGRGYIETVPKRGYRFTAPVRELSAEALVVEKRGFTRVVTEETIADDSSARPMIGADEALAIGRGQPHAEEFLTKTSKIHATKRVEWPWLVVALSSVSLAIAGFFIYRSLTTVPRGQIESIAVLPFKNESGNADVEYLSDGVTESLINSLSQLPQLKVIARSSAFQYKGKQVEPDEVARALNVRAIVTGRIRQQGDDLQISVELMDASDKTQMWGEQYHRRTSDLQAIQAEVARTVAQKLRLRLTGVQEQQLTKRATENAQAYQLYLTGVFHLRKQNLAGHKKALEYFDQAGTLDPNFALAYASMPAVYANLAGTGGLDAKEAIAKGKAAALKALQLDETLSAAHSGMAIILRYEWDWPGAEREFKRAIELNPNAEGAHSSYSLYLAAVGRTTEALAENKIAQELDPFRITFKGNEGGILNTARRYDEALQVSQNVIKMQPEYPFGHLNMAQAYLGKGMFEEAIKEYKAAISLYGETTNAIIDLGYAYAISGKRDEAFAMLNKLNTSKASVSPAALAILYAGLGNKDRAFQLLEQAFSKHDPLLVSLRVEPRYDTLRSDPRFADLLRRMKLTS